NWAKVDGVRAAGSGCQPDEYRRTRNRQPGRRRSTGTATIDVPPKPDSDARTAARDSDRLSRLSVHRHFVPGAVARRETEQARGGEGESNRFGAVARHAAAKPLVRSLPDHEPGATERDVHP